MVDLPKLDLTGFTTVLAGFILLATGLLLYLNTMKTSPGIINPGILKILGVCTALVGVFLLISKDE